MGMASSSLLSVQGAPFSQGPLHGPFAAVWHSKTPAAHSSTSSAHVSPAQPRAQLHWKPLLVFSKLRNED